ncbi:MAG TPA: hypothetical protein VFT98_11420, partial [Myxococcota bacterium]|nr:hypothetical protein [Myxococcota bacterium]
VMVAMLLGARGQLSAGEERCGGLLERSPDALGCRMALATLHASYGRLATAASELRALEKSIGGAARIELWAIHMSLGDRGGAERWLDFGKLAFEKPLSEAARLSMQGRHAEAYAALERGRATIAPSLLLDLPAAKLALIAGAPEAARTILERRLPDLASGVEPVSARNVIAAIDLVAARMGAGRTEEAQRLLARVFAYLDGPAALRLPMFAFQRARAHALAGEAELARRALDRAYDEGFRVSWAVDLRPQSSLYIDPIEADPAFANLRGAYDAWLARIASDAARQRKRLDAADS